LATDASAQSTAVFPRALGDRFELLGELDYGRLGTVYEAVDRTRPVGAGDRTVALLRIPLLSGRSPERIERDFSRLQSLRHANIVPVFELVRGADAYLVTMEVVDGEPLCCVLDSLWPELPSREEAFDVIRAAGAALIHAHARGVVHGDVDAANVLISGAGEVKVPFAATCLLRRGPFAARARDDTRGLARLAYELLEGAEPSTDGGGATRGGREPRRIRGLGRAEQRALHAALCGRDDRVPNVGELAAVFAAPPETPTRTFRWDAPRVAWAAVLIVAIVGVGYELRRDGPLPTEPIVDAQVSPLDAGDELDEEHATDDDEPAIDDDATELQPIAG
jgi:hypothetical protein